MPGKLFSGHSSANTPAPSLQHMRLLAGAGITSGGLAAALTASAFYVMREMTQPSKPGVMDGYTFTPFETNAPYVVVQIPTRAGVALSGWWLYHPVGATASTAAQQAPLIGAQGLDAIRLAGHNRPLIICCEQYRGNKWDMLGIGTALWRAGFQVLLFDYRGHGEHIGTPVSLGYTELQDFLDVIPFAHDLAPQVRFGAVGFSMGAAVALMGAARSPRIAGVVADSAYARLSNPLSLAIERSLHIPASPVLPMLDAVLARRMGFHLRDVEPVAEVRSIAPRPLLIVHGEQDDTTPLADAQALYDAASSPKDLWTLPGVPHCGAYFADRATYTQRVARFFANALGTPPPAIGCGGCTLSETLHQTT